MTRRYRPRTAAERENEVSFLSALFDPSLPFVRNALLAGLLSSVLFGVLGSIVTVRRIAGLAGAVSHAVLGGIGLALFLAAKGIAAGAAPDSGRPGLRRALRRPHRRRLPQGKAAGRHRDQRHLGRGDEHRHTLHSQDSGLRGSYELSLRQHTPHFEPGSRPPGRRFLSW